MKILYIHQYFKTPEEGGAIRSYYLAKTLADNGHEVEMITAHNNRNYLVRDVDGVKTHYLPVSYDNSYGFVRRIFAFLKFAFIAFRLARRLKGVSLVYATSTPLTVGWLALHIRKKLGLPYIFEARDLWPDAPAALGAVKSEWLKRKLYALEKAIYQNAEEIVALSPSAKRIIETRSGGVKVSLLPNMADIELFAHSAGPKDKQAADLLHVRDNDFVLAYFGAIGKVNGLDHLISVAGLCQRRKAPVKIMIIGDGARRRQLMAKARLLPNVFFIPHQGKKELARYLSVGDAAFVSFADAAILETSSPNKFFDALAAGKLTIYNQKGWIKDLIVRSRCGVYADPANPEQTVADILSFMNDAEKLKEYKANARALAEDFSKDKIASDFLDMIERRNASKAFQKKQALSV